MIPVNDLQRIELALQNELKNALDGCISRGWYLLGPETSRFEEEFSAYCGINHCVTVANGTDALELALKALEIGPGDEVATVANAGMYSTIAIKNVGAKPQYVEISSRDLNMDPSALESAVNKKTKAIIATHLYGQLCDIDNIIDIAKRYELPVIEDCAQSHGAMLNGKKAGSFGDLGCFSFYPTKNLGALGDAGAIITKDRQLAERVLKLRQYGWEKKYHSTVANGRNSRMDEFQAAALLIKLPYLDSWNSKRRKIAQQYNDAFQDLNLDLPTCLDDRYVAHLYVLRTNQREALRGHLAQRHIATDVHYPIPDYLQPCHDESYLPQSNDVTKPKLNITEQSCNEVLTLPCFPFLKEEELDKIIKEVRAFFHS